MESFQELELPDFLRHSLKQMNFAKPTPVQAQAIPAGLSGKDVIASAQTGTGKTAAFGIPLLVFLESHKDQMALILTPTRELAMQVLEVLRKLSGSHPLGGSVLLIGGANMGGQLNSLSRKPRLIIGTPGRVIDHLQRGSLNLGQAGFLVLDEADRMLDMGFAPQLEEIRKRLPAKRQTLLFSATIPSDIQTMGSRYLKEPVRITIGTTTQPVTKIAQMVIHTMESKKPDELVGELNERQGSILIFARTQNRVDRIAERLKDQGLKVTRIHGGRSQSQRRQAIEQFRQGNYRILVATDIAARGLDIHHIAHVINYDLPRNPEDYIHRVGRTARAGAEGSSLCFLTPEDRDLWNRILRLIGAPKDSIQVKASRFGNMTPKTSGPSHDSHRPAPRHEGGQRHERQGFKPRDSHSRSKPAHSHTPRHDSRPAPRPAPRSFSGGGSFSGGQEGRPRENQGFAPRRPFDKPQGRPFSPTRSEHGRPPQGRSFDKPRDGFQARPPESTSHPTRTPWDKPDQHGFRKEGGFQKRRHPDGRHQKRSDMHFGRTPSGPDHERGNQNIFHGADKKTPSNQPPHPDEDKQPADNRSSWEKKPYDGTQGRPGGFPKHTGSKFSGDRRPSGGDRPFRPDNRSFFKRGGKSVGDRPQYFGGGKPAGAGRPSGDRSFSPRPAHQGGEGRPHRNPGPMGGFSKDRPGGGFKKRGFRPHSH